MQGSDLNAPLYSAKINDPFFGSGLASISLSNMEEYSDNWLQQARAYIQFQMNLGMTEVFLPASPEEKTVTADLEAVREDLGECTRCPLHRTRTTIVFGEGNPAARLMFIGEGPGADEDRQGRPFVGRVGQLLTRMIEAMGLHRSEVYIANVVKCRPPKNREPVRIEIDTCFPFLEAQIKVIGPEVIVALGKVAAVSLLETKEPIGKLRGRIHYRQGIPLMPTYHPSFLLRNEGDRRWKGEAWSDLKQVMALLATSSPDFGNKP